MMNTRGPKQDEFSLQYDTRMKCQEAVDNPGKFESKPIYVPYFWENYLLGYADWDDGKVVGFDVEEHDRQKFPELKGRCTVKLIENDQGFVIEVR